MSAHMDCHVRGVRRSAARRQQHIGFKTCVTVQDGGRGHVRLPFGWALQTGPTKVCADHWIIWRQDIRRQCTDRRSLESSLELGAEELAGSLEDSWVAPCSRFESDGHPGHFIHQRGNSRVLGGPQVCLEVS